jgi:hypothetical protein
MKHDINKEGSSTKSSISLSKRRTSTTIEQLPAPHADENHEDDEDDKLWKGAYLFSFSITCCSFVVFTIVKLLSLIYVRHMKLNVYFSVLVFTFLCILFETRNENISVMKRGNRIDVC